ncbi:AbrB family transcriptional regulator [Streptomyces indonesiensis]
MAPTSAPLRTDVRPSPTAGSAPKPAPRIFGPRVPRPAPTGLWALIVAGGFAAGLAADAFGVPAPYLLSSLLVGAVLALCGVVRDRLPAPAHRASQALVGALMGSYLTPSALVSAAPVALPLTVVTAATIALSVAVAWFLARGGRISCPAPFSAWCPAVRPRSSPVPMS